MDDKELSNCIGNFKKTGNNLYFEKLYRFFFKKIYRFVLLNISDHQIAEDITINIFYNIYKYITKIRLNPTSFKPWIYKIARNLIIDYYRKEAKYKKTQSLEQYLEEKQINSSENIEKIDSSFIIEISEKNFSDNDIEQHFKNNDILKGLQSLPDIQKQVLILRFVENLDYKSIGIIINKNEQAVRAIKFRAISKLKEFIAK